jgi:hypothetical protein
MPQFRVTERKDVDAHKNLTKQNAAWATWRRVEGYRMRITGVYEKYI